MGLRGFDRNWTGESLENLNCSKLNDILLLVRNTLIIAEEQENIKKAMRVINHYYFKTGTKIPFSDLPNIIHSFFRDAGVKENRFLYYFEDLIFDNRDPTKWGCYKFTKDCPAAGQIHYYDGTSVKSQRHYWISNIQNYSGNIESDIIPLTRKIHKYYGMSENDLYYYDVDFFGKIIPWERNLCKAKERYAHFRVPFDATYLLNEQPRGSGILIHRDCLDTYLLLSIDILHDGMVYDSDRYAEVMKQKLPGIKFQKGQEIILAKDELSEIELANTNAAPLLDEVRSYYERVMPSEKHQNRDSSNYSIAPTLKKAAKKRGYQYNNVFGGIYCLTKKIDNGPVICLGVDSGPSHFSVDFFISLSRKTMALSAPTSEESSITTNIRTTKNKKSCCGSYFRKITILFS